MTAVTSQLHVLRENKDVKLKSTLHITENIHKLLADGPPQVTNTTLSEDKGYGYSFNHYTQLIALVCINALNLLAICYYITLTATF